MSDEFEDEEGARECHHPTHGMMEPGWILGAVTESASVAMLWNGMAGLANELRKRDPHYEFQPEEIVDIIVQNMYTGRYRTPWPDEQDEAMSPADNRITEDEVNQFVTKLDFFGDAGYTDEQDEN